MGNQSSALLRCVSRAAPDSIDQDRKFILSSTGTIDAMLIVQVEIKNEKKFNRGY